MIPQAKRRAWLVATIAASWLLCHATLGLNSTGVRIVALILLAMEMTLSPSRWLIGWGMALCPPRPTNARQRSVYLRSFDVDRMRLFADDQIFTSPPEDRILRHMASIRTPLKAWNRKMRLFDGIDFIELGNMTDVDDWLPDIEPLVTQADLVVICPASTDGVFHELGLIERLGLEHKTVVILPPPSTSMRAAWIAARERQIPNEPPLWPFEKSAWTCFAQLARAWRFSGATDAFSLPPDPDRRDPDKDPFRQLGEFGNRVLDLSLRRHLALCGWLDAPITRKSARVRTYLGLELVDNTVWDAEIKAVMRICGEKLGYENPWLEARPSPALMWWVAIALLLLVGAPLSPFGTEFVNEGLRDWPTPTPLSPWLRSAAVVSVILFWQWALSLERNWRLRAAFYDRRFRLALIPHFVVVALASIAIW